MERKTIEDLRPSLPPSTNNLFLRGNLHNPLHRTSMGLTHILPIRCQNTINISLQRNRHRISTLRTDGRFTKSTSTTNFEVMSHIRIVNVFECVSAGFECGGHAGEGVGVGFGGGNDDDSGRGGWCSEATWG